MSLKILLPGNKIAVKHPPAAQTIPVSPPTPQTVVDVLNRCEQRSDYSMLRTTGGLISGYWNVPVEQLTIKALADLQRPLFRQYLRESHYAPNSVRSFSNYAAILLRCAKQLGCLPAEPDVPEAWKEVRAAMPTMCGRSGFIHYATHLGKTPAQVTESDLTAWSETLLASGRCYPYVVRLKNNSRRALSTSGLAHLFPGLAGFSAKRAPYGIPLHSFPAGLRTEVDKLLEDKQAYYVEKRDWRTRISPATAENLLSVITRLYGFEINIEKRTEIATLRELVTEKIVLAFIKWSLKERGVKVGPFSKSLWHLYAAMRWNPAYQDHDLSWFPSAISGIPRETEEEKRDRMVMKHVDYERLHQIPAMMHDERKKVAKLGKLALARFVHNELLMALLVTLVWRQHNIRICRLQHNLFRKEIPPPPVKMAIPRWAQEMIKANPHAQFWQFRFRASETKNGREVWAILPLRLVSLLEEYLAQHRPVLLRGSDPGTLFLNRRGGPLARDQVIHLVSRLTLKYAQCRATPHTFRHSFAFWSLDHYPENYPTLSRHLWHENIETTLKTYGVKFNESAALCQVEGWLEQLEKTSGHQPQKAPEAKGGTSSAGVPKVPVGTTQIVASLKKAA